MTWLEDEAFYYQRGRLQRAAPAMPWLDEIDALNAQRFADAFSHEIRYRLGQGWIVWTDGAWTQDGAWEKAHASACKIPAWLAAEAISILLEAELLSGPARKEKKSLGNKLLNRAARTCQEARRETMLHLAVPLLDDRQWLI